MDDIKRLFFDLLEIDSPSGFEEPMIKKLMKELEPLCDEVYDTPRGNVVGVQYGTDPQVPKLALAAHMDQVGFIVFNIDKEGFIRFRKLGGSVTGSIQGHQMKLLTEEGPIIGVVGIKPGHITKPEEANKVPPIEELYIDIGTRSEEETIDRGVRIGTPIVWNNSPVSLENNFLAASGVDDRAGLTAIITLARRLSKVEIPSTVYYVGTVEEEIGLRGAEVALYDVDADMALAIDTCPAGWQPDVKMRDLYYEVGMGPCLQIGEFSRITRIGSQVISNWLMEVAEENILPYQSGIMHGGTDASAMQQTRSGIPSLAFSIPRRYSHSPVETLSLDDLSNLVEILFQALRGLDKDFSLHRV
jgi:endoglucanase